MCRLYSRKKFGFAPNGIMPGHKWLNSERMQNDPVASWYAAKLSLLKHDKYIQITINHKTAE